MHMKKTRVGQEEFLLVVAIGQTFPITGFDDSLEDMLTFKAKF